MMNSAATVLLLWARLVATSATVFPTALRAKLSYCEAAFSTDSGIVGVLALSGVASGFAGTSPTFGLYCTGPVVGVRKAGAQSTNGSAPLWSPGQPLQCAVSWRRTSVSGRPKVFMS